MEFDPANPVNKLCAEGMNAEAKGQHGVANELFEKAWNISTNNFEKFTSAHYLARTQKDPGDELKWNLLALNFAGSIESDNIKNHLPSLYLNIGKSYEKLSDMERAKENYQAALQFSGHLPQDQYGSTIRSGVNAALQRIGAANYKNKILDDLINKWCEQKELKPLSIALPAYLGSLGTENDINKLISALSFLSATRCLQNNDQQKIDKLVLTLAESK